MRYQAANGLTADTKNAKLEHFTVYFYFYCGHPKAHLCNIHAVSSASRLCGGMDYLRGETLTNTDLHRFVNIVGEKLTNCVYHKHKKSIVHNTYITICNITKVLHYNSC